MTIRAWTALIVFVLTIAAIAAGKFNRATISLLGAMLLIAFHIIPFDTAMEYVDFNTIGLLMGMMVIVGVLSRSGVFQFVAVKSIKLTGGNGFLILVAITLVTALLSAFLDNVTTVLLISPIVISLVDLIDLNPVPLLISEAIASNIGGTGTLIGDPPNMIVGSFAGFSFADFLVNLFPLAAIILIVSVAFLAFTFRRELSVGGGNADRLSAVDESRLIKDPKVMRQSLIAISLVLLGFVFHSAIHLDASIIALLGAALLLAIVPVDNSEIFQKEVEWPTLIFFISLFIIVGALKETGVVAQVVTLLTTTLQGHPLLAVLVILWFSGIMCIFINNVAFTAIFVHVVGDLAGTLSMSGIPLFWALAAGACLGGNGSYLGAAANVVVADMAVKSGFRLSFADFMKVGLKVVFISLLLSSVYFVLKYHSLV